MKSLSASISEFMKAYGMDASEIMNASKRNFAYKTAVAHVWKNKDASELILAHTNAFYVREDTAPKKGSYKDRKYILCEICIDDPTVRSEVDNLRGPLELALRANGLSFDELRIIPARRGMRKRHPFVSEERQ